MNEVEGITEFVIAMTNTSAELSVMTRDKVLRAMTDLVIGNMNTLGNLIVNIHIVLKMLSLIPLR